MTSQRRTRQQLIAGDGPLAKVPPVAAFALVIGLFLVAVLVRGVLGGVLLGLLALAVAALLATSWRVLAPPARIGRLLILGALIAIAVAMIVEK
jgi:energy-coupling factor transporter transmembrane protein EcfT